MKRGEGRGLGRGLGLYHEIGPAGQLMVVWNTGWTTMWTETNRGVMGFGVCDGAGEAAINGPKWWHEIGVQVMLQ